MARFITPRTHRADEFLSAADANALLGDNIRALRERLLARVKSISQVELTKGQWQTLEFPVPVVNRSGLYVREAPTRLEILEEGLWLSGAEVEFKQTGTGRMFARIQLNGERPIAHVGGYEGQGNNVRAHTWGAWYGFPGDFLETQAFATSGAADDMVLEFTDQDSPQFWAVKLAGRRRPETWTTPPTYVSTDKPKASELTRDIAANLRFLDSPPFALVLGTADENLDTPSSWTSIPTPRVIADNASDFHFNPNTGAFTCRRTGIYLVGGCVKFGTGASSSSRAVRLLRGSTVIAQSGPMPALANTGPPVRVPVITLAAFTAGNTLSIQGWQDSTGAVPSQAERDYAPALWVVRVSEDAVPPVFTEPKEWASFEGLTHTDMNTYHRDNFNFLYGPPAVRATRSTSESATNGAYTTASYNGADDFDNDSMHDHSGGQPSDIVLTRDGAHLVGGHIAVEANANGHRFVRVHAGSIRILQNGGLSGSGAIAAVVPFVTLWRGKAGDILQSSLYQNSGAARNLHVAPGSAFWAVWMGT